MKRQVFFLLETSTHINSQVAAMAASASSIGMASGELASKSSPQAMNIPAPRSAASRLLSSA